jgi:hypothetical protein
MARTLAGERRADIALVDIHSKDAQMVIAVAR